MQHFINVILPLPLNRLFTYRVNPSEAKVLAVGMRVAVPFGKSKIYTGIVSEIHTDPNATYEIKDIEFIIDDEPIVTTDQLRLWDWISSYYMCSIGEVMRAAVPRSLLLESETIVLKNEETEVIEDELTDQEYLVLEALSYRKAAKIQDITNILERKRVLPLLRKMLDKKLIILQEEIYETYKPKTRKHIQLHPNYHEESSLKDLLDDLSRAAKQREVVMTLFMMKAGRDVEVSKKQLIERANVSPAVIKALVDKGILLEEIKIIDRVIQDAEKSKSIQQLSELQENALDQVRKHFKNHKPVFLHGVTSSGKTELYIQLIQEEIQRGKQALYLVPEIGLTTQLISRLRKVFKEKVLVYHSNYNLNERLEVWNHVLSGEPFVIIGARSAIFLPFIDLGLIVVDEEHESTFKQFDPAPRYHARDTAVVLSKFHKANIILGSATPSIETYQNCQTHKYALVELYKRFNNVLMPEINMIDLKEKHQKKRMKGLFSDMLIEHMEETFKNNEQVILFQNRRGYSPILECHTCGHSPQCPNCDVSLTYHKHKNQLRCHYCGFHTIKPIECPSCSSRELDTKGFGTEQVEQQFKELFPDHKISRMDLDTTRGKYSYEKLIDQMETGEIQCLVGTQMVTKGLDFRNVGLVGIMNADSMLNFPDYRAHERTFQLITQVAGRAGRTKKRGKVLVQTYNPYHQILQQVSVYDYSTMFKEQLAERYHFEYPPFTRMIRLTFKHRDYQRTLDAAEWFVSALNKLPKQVVVLGPEFPPVSRIRNQFIVNAMVKITKDASAKKVKDYITRVNRSFEAISNFRAVRCVIDVDFY